MTAEPDDEFSEFMRGRWPAMVRPAYGLTGDMGHAEDVAQAAFARAYASWGRVRRTGDPDAYVRRIVINENRRRFRKRRVAEDLSRDMSEAETAAALKRRRPRRSGGQPFLRATPHHTAFGAAASRSERGRHCDT